MTRGFAAALLLTLAGCGGGSSPTAPTPAPTPVPTPTPLPYVGNWFGTTSLDRPLSFAVGAGGITTLSAEFQVTGGGCRVTGSVKVDFTSPSPVNGNQFSFNSSGSTLDVAVRGVFGSSTAASGELTITTKGAPCGGISGTATWTAAKG